MAGSTASMNRFYAIIAIAAAVGIGALLYLMNRSSSPTVPTQVTVTAADTAGFQGYVLGSDSAAVEIIEYADYQCPACQAFEMVEFPYVKERLIQTGRVRWVYRDFPLDQPHKWTRLSAHSAACANEQGRFWEQHEALYRTQADWSASSNAGSMFRSMAEQNGLDMSAYDACMKSLKFAGRIQASSESGIRMGVTSTPTIIVNGRMYPGVQPYDKLKALVDSLSPAAPTP
jgi:protein-disulfide isomerase